HERGAAGRTLRLDVEVQEAHALCRQLVDARSRGAAKNTSAIDPQLSVAQVVGEHENDVWLRWTLSLSMRALRFRAAVGNSDGLGRWIVAGAGKGRAGEGRPDDRRDQHESSASIHPDASIRR